jgi:sugar-specific transcriptional regulator TrmB
MNNNNYTLKQTLISLGFTDKEADVYLALLNMGKGTVSRIARAAGINRTTGYDILDSLVNKGLASISGKEPKQEYLAESPQKISALYQSQIKKDEVNLKLAESLIPQLSSIHNVAGRPKVRFYEGKDGLQEVYEDTLTAHEAIRAYANVDDMHKALPNFFPHYYHRRTQKGISIKAILPANKAGVERASHDKSENRESALVPDKYYFSPEINIYDDKVMIASWRETLGIIIESKEIADAMKKIFDLSWSEAKRLDKTIRK